MYFPDSNVNDNDTKNDNKASIFESFEYRDDTFELVLRITIVNQISPEIFFLQAKCFELVQTVR
jgi:hypothetical protein